MPRFQTLAAIFAANPGPAMDVKAWLESEQSDPPPTPPPGASYRARRWTMSAIENGLEALKALEHVSGDETWQNVCSAVRIGLNRGADHEKAIAISVGLLDQEWSEVKMEYGTQGVNQAHRHLARALIED